MSNDELLCHMRNWDGVQITCTGCQYFFEMHDSQRAINIEKQRENQFLTDVEREIYGRLRGQSSERETISSKRLLFAGDSGEASWHNASKVCTEEYHTWMYTGTKHMQRNSRPARQVRDSSSSSSGGFDRVNAAAEA